MQPNELTLEAQVFDAKINSMDKTCLLAPLSFFDACNVSTDEERLRRMMLLRTRALQLGISEQEYADRRDNYTSQFDADPSYCLKIARMALRRQAMQELGFTPMADVETRQAEYLIEPYLPLDAITILAGVAGMGKTWLALKWAADISTGRATKDGTPGLVYYFTQENDPHIVLSPRLESLGAECVEIRQKADLEGIQGIVLPGGESTVQGKLLHKLDMFREIQTRIREGLPVLATCAGMILLAQTLYNDPVTHLATLPVTVRRNAYGRQLGSFITDQPVKGIGEFPMVFIRAPYIESVDDSDVEVLSTVDDHIVAVRYGNQLGLSFHPEMTEDTRIHEYFLKMIQ